MRRTALIAGLLVIFGTACGRSPEAARAELAQRGISYSSTVFVERAAGGDADSVELFVVAGMDPNVVVGSRTALAAAAAADHVAVLDALLDGGAQPSLQSPDGLTALMVAAQSGRLGATQRLIARGAMVDQRGAGGRTALMLAAGQGHPETVRALIDAGANANARDNAGNSVFRYASWSNSSDVIEVLTVAAPRTR